MRVRQIDTINWRNGALSPYESIVGAQQRFCRLNLVRPLQFLDFAEEVGALTRRMDVKYWNLRIDLPRIDLDRLGKVLGEPKHRLGKSQRLHYFPNICCWDGATYEKFRYCPECLGRGYHSEVHQLEWLDKCLLHGQKLLDACPQCGVTFSFGSRGSSKMPIRQFQCVACSTSLWPGIDSKLWPTPLTAKAVKPITEYLDWIFECNNDARAVGIRNSLQICGKNSALDRVNELSILIKAPAVVELSWMIKTTREPIRWRVYIDSAKSDRITQVMNEFGIESIVAFVTKGWINATFALSLGNAVLYMVRHLEKRHRCCRRLAHKIRNGPFCEGDFFKILGDSICNVCTAAKHFRLRFLWDFSKLASMATPRQIEEASNRDAVIRDQLISRGLLVKHYRRFVSGGNGQGRKPRHDAERVQWVTDPALVRVTNFIVKQHVKSYLEWLLTYFSPDSDSIDDWCSRYRVFGDLKACLNESMPDMYLSCFPENASLVVLGWADKNRDPRVYDCCDSRYAHATSVADTANWLIKAKNQYEAMRYDKLYEEVSRAGLRRRRANFEQ